LARVTVEDCVERVPNRFNLVLLAAHRARLIGGAVAVPAVDRDDDKDPVVALREIGDAVIDLDILRDHYVSKFQDSRPAARAEREADKLALQAAPSTSEDEVLKALQAEQEAQREERF
jgi:DNA-directed RNA polymerase subunit omega